MAKERAVSVQVKLAAAWASLMFCYIYADFFSLFEKGRLATMNQGLIPPLGEASDQTMLFVSAWMAIPSLMIFLSVVLTRPIARWLNMIVGLVYAGIIAMIMRDSTVLLFFGLIEVALSLAIIAMAWRWTTTSRATP